MASDGQSVKIPAASLVHGSQAPTIKFPQAEPAATPQRSNVAAVRAAAPAVVPARSAVSVPVKASVPATQSVPAKASVPAIPDLHTQVTLLNKYLNDSGRPDQFRVDPSSDDKIQELNPVTGEVIAEYSATEFAALARSLGVSGVLVDGHA